MNLLPGFGGGSPPPPAPIIVFQPPPTPPPQAPVQREAPKPLPVVEASTEQKRRRTQANKGRQASVLTSGQGVTNPLGAEGIARPTAGRLG